MRPSLLRSRKKRYLGPNIGINRQQRPLFVRSPSRSFPFLQSCSVDVPWVANKLRNATLSKVSWRRLVNSISCDINNRVLPVGAETVELQRRSQQRITQVHYPELRNDEKGA